MRLPHLPFSAPEVSLSVSPAQALVVLARVRARHEAEQLGAEQERALAVLQELDAWLAAPGERLEHAALAAVAPDVAQALAVRQELDASLVAQAERPGHAALEAAQSGAVRVLDVLQALDASRAVLVEPLERVARVEAASGETWPA